MLAAHPIIAFAAITDPDRARRFYQDTLGLRLVAEDPFALTFDAHGTTLRLQKIERLTPQPFTVLGWQLADLRPAIATLVERGVRFERFGFLEQDDLGIWTAPGGAQVAWFKDPDGNTLSLSTPG